MGLRVVCNLKARVVKVHDTAAVCREGRKGSWCVHRHHLKGVGLMAHRSTGELVLDVSI